MFDGLTERLSGVFDRLGGRGVLSEKDIDEALREVRVALLEADVALPVVTRLHQPRPRKPPPAKPSIRSVTPADQVVKIVYDGLVDMLGGEERPSGLNLALNPPTVILMAGLQGSGKTTTAGKLALRLNKIERKKVLVASLDTRRPAAMEQLAMLAKQVGVESLPIVAGQTAADIARRAMTGRQAAGLRRPDPRHRRPHHDGRGDDEPRRPRSRSIATPSETLLVADSLTGQDAVRTAKAFHERLPLTGLVLTRADGDGRGGAALSMRARHRPADQVPRRRREDRRPGRVRRPPRGRPHPGPGRRRRPGREGRAGPGRGRRPRRMAKKLAKGQFDLER